MNSALTLYHLPQFPLDSGKEFVGLGTGFVGWVIGKLTVGLGAIKGPPGGLLTKVSSQV